MCHSREKATIAICFCPSLASTFVQNAGLSLPPLMRRVATHVIKQKLSTRVASCDRQLPFSILYLADASIAPVRVDALISRALLDPTRRVVQALVNVHARAIVFRVLVLEAHKAMAQCAIRKALPALTRCVVGFAIWGRPAI